MFILEKFLDKSHELTDHLGNVRVTFKKNTDNTLSVLSKADYYAFGGQLPGRIWQQSGGDYRFGYQGQEKSMDETNWDNFELRNFNHDLGRWSAPDPYAQFHSPYLAMANNPVNNIDPNGGYMVASDQGMAQRRQFMFDLDMDRMHQRGYFSFERLNKNYHDRLMELVAKRYAHGTTYFDDATHNDEGLLNAIMSLNNEYAGLGYPNELMSVGIDFIAAGSRNTAIFKSLIEFNGSASKAEAMAAVANNLQYSVDLLHSAEQNWMSENDARQRAYVSAWRNEKWAKMDEEAKRKKEIKEAKEREKILHSQTDILAAALNGNLILPGFAGGASVAGTSTVNPGASSKPADLNGKDYIGPILIGIGARIKALKPVAALGSQPGSSIASTVLSKALPLKMPFGVAGTTNFGRMLGRVIPFTPVGVVMTALSIEDVMRKYSPRFNLIVGMRDYKMGMNR